MSGVLVMGEVREGQLRPITFELIGAARQLSAQGAGPVTVLIVAKAAGEAAQDEAGEPAQAASVAGVDRILVADSPCERFEAHVSQRALEAAIAAERPSLVLCGHTIDSLGFAAAVAARGGHGFSGDLVSLSWSGQGALAQRQTHGGKLVAQLDFPGRETVIALLRAGAFAPASEAGAPALDRLEVDLSGSARSKHLALRDAPAGEVDIASAELLLSIGRGIGEQESVPRFERLAASLGATLAASRPLVDAGWVAAERQVGQSGRTVAPKVYLALGISGAVQHLAGMSRAETIIAVNSDAAAPIFAAAHYGAIADLFEIAEAIEQQLQ